MALWMIQRCRHLGLWRLRSMAMGPRSARVSLVSRVGLDCFMTWFSNVHGFSVQWTGLETAICSNGSIKRHEHGTICRLLIDSIFYALRNRVAESLKSCGRKFASQVGWNEIKMFVVWLRFDCWRTYGGRCCTCRSVWETPNRACMSSDWNLVSLL